MNFKKIPSRKRIKVNPILTKHFKFNFWEHSKTASKLYWDFGMQLTSRRCGIFYFKVIDQKKFSLFLMGYSEFIVK